MAEPENVHVSDVGDITMDPNEKSGSESMLMFTSQPTLNGDGDTAERTEQSVPSVWM